MDVVQNLIAGAAQLQVELSKLQAEALLRLLNELDDWNQRINLTAIKDREQQITKHLLDSLSVNRYLRGTHIADIGTGAGFPGLPLALVNPDKHFTLVDATAKKLRFVEHAAAAMGVSNITALHSRAEALKPNPRFDCLVSRAVGTMEKFVGWCGSASIGGGKLLAMKGRYPEEELAHLPNGWKAAAVHKLKIPGLDEERHLVEICRSHDQV